MILAAALVLAAAVAWGARLVAAELAAAREGARQARTLTILGLFTPALDAAQRDPRALLVWQPLARSARTLYPEEFARIDGATGSTFPFSADALQTAHARWTTEWLAWERGHDATYKRKAIEAQEELADAAPAVARARLEAIEQEKLELYQRRYEEYVRVAKALQALT